MEKFSLTDIRYGNIICSSRADLKFSADDRYFEAVAKNIAELLNREGLGEKELLGVGVGLQALTSQKGEELIYGKSLNCTGLRIDGLSKRLGCHCRFVHDAECAAAFELWWSPENKEAIYLSLGLHFGGAIISGGSIRSGRSGTFEHMTLVDKGKSCYCGKQGCAECYCSAEALLNSEESLTDFFKALRDGDENKLRRWSEYLNWLALTINNVHMVIDSKVILGGHIAPFLISEDLERLFMLVQQRSPFPEGENFLTIGVQEKELIASGAAVSYLAEFISQISA